MTNPKRQQLSAHLPHPMQPVFRDEQGTIRFKRNALVEYLLDNGGIDMNKIAIAAHRPDCPFTVEDQEQFAQLIGYSVAGFHELSYVSDEAAAKASELAKQINPDAGGCRDDGCHWHTHGAEE